MPKKWVLIVDDDPAVLEALELSLEHPELSVTTASDAAQAFIQARDLKPFVIVSDIQMPGFGDGTTIIKHLRGDPGVPRMPIVFMTGMNLAKAAELLPRGDPTIGLMQKPVDPAVLRDYVWRLAGIDVRAEKWVLVVDDDPAVRETIKTALEHPELSLATAADTTEAFLLACDRKPVVVIMDIQMPGFGDGTKILKPLRQDPRVPRMPIVFITGMNLDKAAELLPKDDPTIGLMQKPVDLARLRDYVWTLAKVAPL